MGIMSQGAIVVGAGMVALGNTMPENMMEGVAPPGFNRFGLTAAGLGVMTLGITSEITNAGEILGK